MNQAAKLFDPPGPRGRRRLRAATVAATVVGLAILAAIIWQLDRHGQLAADQWRAFGQWPVIRFLLIGLKNTLIAGLIAAGIAFPVAALAAVGRLSKHRFVSYPVGLLVEFFRAMPLLLLIFFALLVLPPAGIKLPVMWQLILPIVVYDGAITAEVFRAGILAIPRGQTEAGLALGLRERQVMRHVVFPQAVRILLPQLVMWFIRIVKDTTLGYIVSYPELLESGKTLGAFNNTLLSTYLVVAVIFVVVNVLLARLASLLETYLSHRGGIRRTRRRRAAPSSPGDREAVSSYVP